MTAMLPNNFWTTLKEKKMTERYKAVEGAEHGCCHEASVIDTTKRLSYANDALPDYMKYELVAECPELETAVKLAVLLNAYEDQQ